MNKQIKKNKKGFTLVEMIVVIAIIGVLAAMMVPSLLGYIEKAHTSNNRAAAATIGRAAATVAAEQNVTSASVNSEIAVADKFNDALKAMVEGSIKGHYKVDLNAGTIKVVYNPKSADYTPTITTQSDADYGVYPEG